MNLNTEIKARACTWQSQKNRAMVLSGQEGRILHQEDTYFSVTKGRLKLRITREEKSAVLVFYQQSDIAGPKESEYLLMPLTQNKAAPLKQVLKEAVGVLGVVRKTRHLFMIDRNRIHFDEVEGLGRFIEIEHVHGMVDSCGSKVTKIEGIMKVLSIQGEDLIEGSYVDLILKTNDY